MKTKAGVETHIHLLATQEAEGGKSCVWDQPGLHKHSRSQKQQQNIVRCGIAYL